MRAALSLTETVDMFRQVAQYVVQGQDALTQADRAIGDGDHGVGMARGFEATLKVLETGNFSDLKSLLGATGMALMTSIGGASGVIFGTWFNAGGKNLAGQVTLDAAAFQTLLRDGLAGVQLRGKAKPGDKTMLDALAPALQAVEACRQEGLLPVFEAAAQAASRGAESTKTMLASVGRAKTLGPRSLGFVDPGALSVSLILDGMVYYIKGFQDPVNG